MTSLKPLSPIIKRPDFLIFLLKPGLFYVSFHDPARACFSSRRRTAIIPTSYPRRHARLKVYPHLPHRPSYKIPQPATTRQLQFTGGASV